MVRSLYYKMVKYMDSQSIDKMKELQKDVRRWENNYRDEQKERMNLLRKINTLQRLKRVNEGEYISIDDLIEIEKQKANIKEEEFI